MLLLCVSAHSKSVLSVDDGYLVPQCCCAAHHGSMWSNGPGRPRSGHTDYPPLDHSRQFVEWPWHEGGLDMSGCGECDTVRRNRLDIHHCPSCHMSQASLLPWQQSKHTSHASLLPCQQCRHASHASLLPCQQSRHASHASLLPCQHGSHASQALLLPWPQSRHASQVSLLPWQLSRHDICDSCHCATMSHHLDTSTQRWSTVDRPLSRLRCSYCDNSMCCHAHCRHQYYPPGRSISVYSSICDDIHRPCAMNLECESLMRDHKAFSPPSCSCGLAPNHTPRWQHNYQCVPDIGGTADSAAPPVLACHNSVDSLPSYSDAYSGTINPDFISMISLNSPSIWEPRDCACCHGDKPRIQRLENFGTETQGVGWEECCQGLLDPVGFSPHRPMGRQDVGGRWRPSETQSVPDLCHQPDGQVTGHRWTLYCFVLNMLFCG